MNERNKKTNIQVELEKASQSHKEAQILAQNDLFSGAISRLYYSVFHTVRALLLTKGLQPKSHEGVSHLLSRHFVKQKILPPRAAHIFSRLMKYREEADYNPSYVFTGDDFEDFQKEARELSSAILAYLEEQGYVRKGNW